MADKVLLLLYDCAENLGDLCHGPKTNQLYTVEGPKGGLALLAYLQLMDKWVDCVTTARNQDRYEEVNKSCIQVRSQIGNVSKAINEKVDCKKKKLDAGVVGRLKASITNLKRSVGVTRMPIRECLDELEAKGGIAALLWPD